MAHLGVVVVCCLVLGACHVSTQDRHQQADLASREGQEAKQVASDLLAGGSPFVVLPIFTVQGTALSYHLGALDEHALVEGVADAFELSVLLHLRALTLRTAFERYEPGQAYWRPYIDRLAALADQAFLPGRSQDRIRGQVSSVLAELENALLDTASARGLIATRLPGGPTRRVEKVLVDIQTTPPGGQVRLMKLLTYRKERYAGKTREAMSWIRVLTDSVPLLGVYRYWVQWPDGREAEDSFDVVPQQGKESIRAVFEPGAN